MTDYQSKRSKGEPVLNNPLPTVLSSRDVVEPVGLSAPQNAPAPVDTPEGDKLSFTPRKWGGVKDVFECDKCGNGTYRDTKDEIILHILTHVPVSEQDALLDKLTKEK